MDYSLGPLPLSITFAPSDNMHPVPFEIIDDIFTEENETFTLSLSLASPSQSIQIGQSTTQVTIEDDDSKWLLCILVSACCDQHLGSLLSVRHNNKCRWQY